MTPLPVFSAPDADSRKAEHGAALSEVGRLARRVRELEASNVALVDALKAADSALCNNVGARYQPTIKGANLALDIMRAAIAQAKGR